jgi:para-nitrobenzyl esterase
MLQAERKHKHDKEALMLRLSSIRGLRSLTGSVALPALLLVAAGPGVQADPIQIESGSVSGEVIDAESGIRVYKGIPFAAPPVGDLRWKPPQPVAPWDGVRACTEYGPACPQRPQMPSRILVREEPQRLSEDCLYLNVWTPAKSSNEKLPVMVWIHGGGFDSGWGHQRDFEGKALARKGAVVVTINYRLGPFGFFAHPLLSKESERDVSGNYGLLDQIAALEWVQKNISAFGGDPGCVTIFGESAGGFSVNLLRVSPLAKGLFHRAISQSGPGGTATGAPLAGVEALGESLARELVGEECDDVLAALRAVPTEELMRVALRSLSLEERMSGAMTEPTYEFGPAVDGWVLREKGLPQDVPLILGMNAGEGFYWVTLEALESVVSSVEGFRAFVEWQYGELADDVLALYPARTKEQVPGAFAAFFGDTTFARSVREVARAMDEVNANAYLYCFSRKSLTDPALGSYHSVEIAYVFNNLGDRKVDDVDVKLADTMSSIWVRFAATGNPNGEGLPEWPAYETESDQYLELGDTIRVGRGLRKETCDALDRIMAARLSRSSDAKD